MNAKTIKLSICIPTYNFGEFIGETLDSLIPQLNEEIEIVIVDGASTDNTPSVVAKYLQKSSQIKYFRLQQKGGIDKDMELSVRLSRGDYCWLFSSDDVMLRDSIEKILNELKTQHDLYLCGFTVYSLDMQNPIEKHLISNLSAKQTFDLSKQNERLAYFRLAQTTTAFFSFMSSLVIKKSRWDAVNANLNDFYGSCWAHVARIFNFFSHEFKLSYLPETYFLKRNENDSFSNKGPVHRLSIGVDGYNKIADKFFGHDSEEAYHIRRALKNEISLGVLYRLKKQIRSKKELSELNRIVMKFYCDRTPSNIAKTLAFKFTPIFAYRFAYKTYKRIKATINLS